MAFSFPYPTNGTVTRPAGQGCSTCVHFYCMALYWFKRYTLREPDNHNGIRCASWSNNPADQIKTPPTATDLAEGDYIYEQAIGSEPTRNGMTDQTTGTWKRP